MQGTVATAVPLSNNRDVRLTECFVLSWVSGLLLCSFFHKGTVSSAWLTAAIGFCMLVIVCLLCHYAKRRVIACILGGVAALCSWNIHTFLYAKPLLALDGQTVSVAGVITDSTPYDGGTVRYTVRFSSNGMPANAYWYAANAEAETIPQIGDKIRGDATFLASDSEYNAQRNVFLILRNASFEKVGSSSIYVLKRAVRSYRDTCAANIMQHMPKQNAALLLAMLFGDDRNLADDTAAALYRTGIGHVMAVSGLHLVFFCTALSFILHHLRFGVRAVLCGNLIAMLLFVVMVDSAISVMRAAIMLLLSLIAPIFGRKRDAGRSLCIAMFICTLPTPYVIGSASFWLSVSGVFGLTILAPYMRSRKPEKQNGIAAVWCVISSKLAPMFWVWLAVLPAAVLLCGETSLLSMISNAILLPLCTTILGVGLLSVALGGIGVVVLPVANVLCRIVLMLAQLLAKLPFASLSVVHQSTKTLLILAVCVLILLRLMHRADPNCLRVGVMLVAAVLLIQISMVRLMENRTLSLALLGECDTPAIVCIANDTIVLIDQSGDSDNVRLAADYLEENGRYHITALVLPNLRNIAAYESRLCNLTVDHVYLGDATGLRADTTLCGCVPESYTDSMNLQTQDIMLTLFTSGFTLQWDDMLISVPDADSTQSKKAAVEIRLGEQITVTDAAQHQTLYEENLRLRFVRSGAWQAEYTE